MNTRTRGLLVAAPTTAAWVLLTADAVLPDLVIDLADGMSILTASVAATGSLILAGWARARPVAEVYDLGYEPADATERSTPPRTRSATAS